MRTVGQVSPDPRAVAIALFIVVVALAVVVAYLARQVTDLSRRAEAYDDEAGAWKTNYYALRARYDIALRDREDLLRRNSQLTSALQLTTDLAGGPTPTEDDTVIAELERQFRNPPLTSKDDF